MAISMLKVIAHSDVPFVLIRDNQIVKDVFEFLQHLHARGMSSKTIRAYAFDLLSFHRFVQEQSLSQEQLNSHHITEFILFQRNEKAAPRTINRRLTVIRAFLNHVESYWGDRVFQTQNAFYKGQKNKALLGPSRINKNKRTSLKVKVPYVLITPLSQAETHKFFLGLRKYRDKAILHLMLFCGLRSSCSLCSSTVFTTPIF